MTHPIRVSASVTVHFWKSEVKKYTKDDFRQFRSVEQHADGSDRFERYDFQL